MYIVEVNCFGIWKIVYSKNKFSFAITRINYIFKYFKFITIEKIY